MVYDPNYNYEGSEGSADEEGDMLVEEEEAGEGEECPDSEEYSDDDDMSWKVRRAAAKCLESVIATRHELLAEFYRTVSPALIARFKGESSWNFLLFSYESTKRKCTYTLQAVETDLPEIVFFF